MGNRSRQAIFGFITDLGGNALLSVVAILTVPIFLRLTSVPQYGFWLTMLSIFGFLALADLGIGVSLSRLVAGLTGEHDRQSLSRLVSSAFFAFCMVGLVFLCAGIGLSHFIPRWFKIPTVEVLQILPAYQVAILAGGVALPLSTFSSVIVAFQRMAVNNTVFNLTSLIAIGISLMLLFTGLGVIALAFSMLFTIVVTGLINYLMFGAFVQT